MYVYTGPVSSYQNGDCHFEGRAALWMCSLMILSEKNSYTRAFTI
jgi:hypothetical protein